MRLSDLFFLALKDLSGRKIRSWLTIIGIVIGIAAVVGLIGSAQSIQDEINNQLQKLQADSITIIPGKLSFAFLYGGGSSVAVNPLTSDDLNALKKIPLLSGATGTITKNLVVENDGETFSLQVVGVDPEDWDQFYNLAVLSGRKLSQSDKNSALIGNSVAYKLFRKDLKVRSSITISGQDFNVVGILESAGGFMSTDDTNIYVPLDVARNLMDYPDDYYSRFSARVKEGEDISAVSQLIEQTLLRSRKVSEADFAIITPDFMQGIVNNILSLMIALLGSIAAISLVVGAIGIANTMYMTVLEKTREIGIMKAIGAKDGDVLKIFLLESGIIGLIGGALGILLGYILGSVFLLFRNSAGGGFISEFGAPSGVQATLSISFVMTPEIIILSLVFSFVMGILSGVIPARKAARMNTINALRYE
jgi:putative ABC transport system permease protein